MQVTHFSEAKLILHYLSFFQTWCKLQFQLFMSFSDLYFKTFHIKTNREKKKKKATREEVGNKVPKPYLNASE